jgi:hypothetical protein
LLADAAAKAKGNPSIRFHHGMVLAEKGESNQAAEELKAALALNKTFPKADEARRMLEKLKAE